MIYVSFINLRTDKCRTVGPFSTLQVRYGEIVTGTDGDRILASESATGLWVMDGVAYTDFAVFNSPKPPARAQLPERRPPPTELMCPGASTKSGDVHQHTMAVACANASGEADLLVVTVDVTDDQLSSGEHYKLAIARAERERYEGPFVCFDEVEQRNIRRAYAQLPRDRATWHEDAIQFPRLLAELADVGHLTSEQTAAVADSMDLDVSDVRELFARAEEAWDAIKTTLPGTRITGLERSRTAQEALLSALAQELAADLITEGRRFSGAKRTIRVNLSALTRREFSADVEVPAEFGHEDCLALVELADEAIESDQYWRDFEYWERGDRYYVKV